MNFRYARHTRIWQTLSRADVRLLADNKVFFVGGTCIALFYGEHRESEDMDFLCDADHYGALRNTVTQRGLDAIFPGAQSEIRVDRYGIRGRVDGIRLEIVLEARAPVYGAVHKSGILIAAPECLMAQKLLANSDRGMDEVALHKDIIDLAVLYGKSPESFERAYGMAYGAYKDSVARDFSSAMHRFARPAVRRKIVEKLKMESKVLSGLLHGMVQMRNAMSGKAPRLR